MKKTVVNAMVAVLVVVGAAVGCKKNATSGTTKVQVRMTDAPGNFEKINLSVKEIILISGGKPYVMTSNVSTFNILDYRIAERWKYHCAQRYSKGITNPKRSKLWL